MPVPVMRGALPLVACAALLAAPGCGGDQAWDDTPAMVVLGTGELDFDPLADGDPIFVVHGPQGGYHVNGSVRITGISPGNPRDLVDPSNPTVEFRVYAGSERVDAEVSRYTQGLEPSDERGVYEMVGRRVILDIADDGELVGLELRLEVSVVDPYGNQAADARRVLAVAHPNNQ